MAGTILRVDLTTGKMEKQPTAEYVKDYIGGAGIGLKILWDEVPPEISAYDPKNLLLFNAGVLTGTPLGTKCEVASKSPEITNAFYAHNGMGGQFGAEMKFAGYDHIVIRGKADKPVYLAIHNDDVEIRDAKHLWGLDTQGTQTRIWEESKDPDVKIACIGPAGENLNVYAAVLHEIENTASRGGLAAVMGSKNLKAVAVRGTKGIKIADPEAFMALFEQYFNHYKTGRGAYMGRILSQEGLSRHGFEGYRYKDTLSWGYESYVVPPVKREDSIAEFNRQYRVGGIGCAFCPIQCKQNYSVPGIDNGGATCTAFCAFRFALKYHDPKLWWKGLAATQRYGIDFGAVTNITSWLMYLYEKGLITAADTDGIPMVWGSEEAQMTVIEKISKREGFGKLFTDGIVPAAKVIADGKGLEFLRQVKNRPLWMVNPIGIGGPVAPLGRTGAYRTGDLDQGFDYSDRYANVPPLADMLESSYEEAEKLVDEWTSEDSERRTGDRDVWRRHKDSDNKKIALLTVEGEDEYFLCDIAGHCAWLSDNFPHWGCWGGIEEEAQWFTAATGTRYTTEMVREAVQRGRALRDAYNALCYKTIREKSVHSPKVVEPVPDGYYKNLQIDREKSTQVAAEYCAMRGYDPKTGIPTRVELERLGLKDVADKLENTLAALEKASAKP